jgi:hypothetical protein
VLLEWVAARPGYAASLASLPVGLAEVREDLVRDASPPLRDGPRPANRRPALQARERLDQPAA